MVVFANHVHFLIFRLLVVIKCYTLSVAQITNCYLYFRLPKRVRRVAKANIFDTSFILPTHSG